MKFDWLGRGAALALIATMPIGTASAETLQEALADAYNNNPDLTSQRAAVRALASRSWNWVNGSAHNCACSCSACS